MKLSIITINKNNAAGLRKTIESVICQTFKDYEYIVIDGASSDDSVNVINEYYKHLTYFVSEPDDGIYYAMNKGIKAANGEYCLFLNSGDYLVSNSILEKAFEYNFFEDVVYGDAICKNYIEEKILRKYDSTLSVLNFFPGANWCCINHQNSFIKKSLFFKFGFYRTDLKILSDQAFFVKVIFEGGSTYRYIPIAITVYDITGINIKNATKTSEEIKMLTVELFKNPVLHNSIKSIVFYDRICNTPLVKSSYYFYNKINSFIIKIKRFFGKDFYYNNAKYLKLKSGKRFLPEKIQIPENKKLLIWGTGDDGFGMYNYCNLRKIFIYGFLDSSEAKQQYAFFGRPVFAPEFALENKMRDFFIVVASRKYYKEITDTCREAGLIEDKDFVVPF